MFWTNIFLIITTILALFTEDKVTCGNEEMFFKNVKNVPRIGRTSNSVDSFENFFLKASKNVPRIGRRNFDMNEQYYKDNSEWYKDEVPDMRISKKFDAGKEMPWADLADRVEYYPELMMSPTLLATASLKDMENYGYHMPEKRTNIAKSKEEPEIRLQAIV